jgi:hypothetical protein
MSGETPAVQPAKGPSRLWLPIVLTLGLFVGLVLSYSITVPYGWRFIPPQFQELIIVHTVLSTVSIMLLVALTIIYVRVYAETGARFSLGITVVLFALLVQALVQYPLLEGLFVPFGEGQGSFLTSADLFTIAAYSLFLYLSLE